jgi:hypothetical protein
MKRSTYRHAKVGSHMSRIFPVVEANKPTVSSALFGGLSVDATWPCLRQSPRNGNNPSATSL